MNAQFISVRRIALLVLGLGLAAACTAIAQDGAGDGSYISFQRILDADPGWNVAASATWYQRGTLKGIPLVKETADPTSAVTLSAADVSYPANTGIDFSIIRRNVFGTPWDIEARYLRTDSVNSTGGPVPAPVGAFVQYQTPIGVESDHDGDMLSWRNSWLMQSGEVNFRYPWGDCCELFVGGRYFQLNDTAFDITQIAYVGLPNQNTLNHHIETTNDLLGAQVGLWSQLYGRGRLGFDGFMKAGLYGNSMTTRSLLTSTQTPSQLSTSASEIDAAFLGEAGVSFTYYLTNGIVVRLGYTALVGNGFVVAPEQIPVMNPLLGTSGVNNNGAIVLQGANLGLEMRF